jgi:hypothetical protein
MDPLDPVVGGNNGEGLRRASGCPGWRSADTEEQEMYGQFVSGNRKLTGNIESHHHLQQETQGVIT